MNETYAQHLRRSHQLVLIATAVVALLGYLAAYGLLFTGRATDLTLSDINVILMVSVVIFSATYWIARRMPLHPATKYLTITSMSILIFLFDCFISSRGEAFLNIFAICAISIIYFDFFVSAYAMLLTLVVHTLLLFVAPGFMPEQIAASVLTTRYTCFLITGVSIAIAARAGTQLVMKAVIGQQEAVEKTASLMQVATGVMDRADVILSSSQQVLSSANETGNATEDVKSGMINLSRSAMEGALFAEKTADSARQMLAALNTAVDNVQLVTEQSSHFRIIVEEGRLAMHDQETNMQDSDRVQKGVSAAVSTLDGQSQQIQNIVALITGIADQTNLLALNAAIEAARAGEAGRGFAVVAEEVRKLAEESGTAASEISALINKMKSSMEQTIKEIDSANQAHLRQVAALERTERMFAQIEQGSQNIDTAVQELSAINEENLAITDEVVSQIQSIASSSRESSLGMEQMKALSVNQTSAVQTIVALTQSLVETSDHLRVLVAGFSSGDPRDPEENLRAEKEQGSAGSFQPLGA